LVKARPLHRKQLTALGETRAVQIPRLEIVAMEIHTKAKRSDRSFPLLVFFYNHDDRGNDHRNHHGNAQKNKHKSVPSILRCFMVSNVLTMKWFHLILSRLVVRN
jgi:hypothetical protein